MGELDVVGAGMTIPETKTIVGYDLGDGTSQTAVVVMEKNEEGKLVVREAHVGEDARKWLLVNAPQTLRD